jgi:hypothetical protein
VTLGIAREDEGIRHELRSVAAQRSVWSGPIVMSRAFRADQSKMRLMKKSHATIAFA